jgi:hypothetical protein
MGPAALSSLGAMECRWSPVPHFSPTHQVSTIVGAVGAGGDAADTTPSYTRGGAPAEALSGTARRSAPYADGPGRSRGGSAPLLAGARRRLRRCSVWGVCAVCV